MALSVQKMQIFDNDFRELFENNAMSIHLLYESKVVHFTPNNAPFDAQILEKSKRESNVAPLL